MSNKGLSTDSYKGVRDFYPEDMAIQRYIFDVWGQTAESFGYERYDNPEVVALINALTSGPYRQLLNYFHASLKLERKEREEGRVKRIYPKARTPLARVLASSEVTERTKRRLRAEKAQLNPFALKQEIARSLKEIEAIRQADPERL